MKKIQMAVMAVLISFFTVDGMAGLTTPAPVIVDLTNRFAQGNQVTARFSDNDVEFIGCGTRIFDTGGAASEFGFCQASDAADMSIVCLTVDADLINEIRAVSDFSFITFSWDTNDDCTRIGSSSQSFYIPDFHLNKEGNDDDDDDDDDD